MLNFQTFQLFYPPASQLHLHLKISVGEQEMFTYDEVVDFLKNSWGVENCEERLKNDRKNLADEIVQVVHEKVAFQSISHLSSADKHKRPTYDEIKRRCMKGIGGLCCDIAPFTWGLFKALGFSVRMVSALVTSTAPNKHVLLLIYGLESESDVHLVDCGTGFGTFHVISLNFSKESPVFRDSFAEYKYIRLNGRILRMHGKGDFFKRSDPPKEDLDFYIGHWRRFYSFDPDEKPCDPHKPVDDVHRMVSAGLTPFASSPRAVRYPGKRAVAIFNNRFIVENESGELVTTLLESDEEILNAYRVHFPQLEQDAVRGALAGWHRVTSDSK